jgi:hypothetical protein
MSVKCCRQELNEGRVGGAEGHEVRGGKWMKGGGWRRKEKTKVTTGYQVAVKAQSVECLVMGDAIMVPAPGGPFFSAKSPVDGGKRVSGR